MRGWLAAAVISVVSIAGSGAWSGGARAATIEGTIVAAGTGQPVAGAKVETAGASATSDAAGRFRLELPAGTYVVMFRHPSGGTVTQTVKLEEDVVKLSVTLDLATEVITIRQKAPVSQRRAPEPVENYGRLRPPYTGELIDANDWAVVWLRLTVDERGEIARVEVLKSPKDYKLDEPTVKFVKRFRFRPGLDDDGRAAPYQIIYKLEWVPYWDAMLVAKSWNPPCRGQAPLNLGSFAPAYRDCEPPPGLGIPPLEQCRRPYLRCHDGAIQAAWPEVKP
ncbi:MAG TPA: TonB family protein [Haliangiales bacterium]|nr:TonB family protein [Haliangiales bacterium]